MKEMTSSAPVPTTHLRTKYVFVDTQSFRQARFDWGGKKLSKLVEFARAGHLCLLTTEITKREIASQLLEVLKEAENAVRKHRVVFEQLGVTEAVPKLTDPDALKSLEAEFANFLTNVRATDVPLTAEVGRLFDDYFARRPPFSEKKKSEFPDAAVVASLRSWCETHKATSYVVSGDPDLISCCVSDGPLIWSESIGDIISKATVSKELYDALEKAITENETLSDTLAEHLKDLDVETSRRGRYGGPTLMSGKVEQIDDISIHYVNVLEHVGRQFTCEIEFEAELIMELEIEIEGQYNYDDYEPSHHFSLGKTIRRIFLAEIVADFDSTTPDEIAFDSVYVSARSIELDSDELSGRGYRW
jgi:PIN domain